MNSGLVVIVTRATEKFPTNLATALPENEISAMLRQMGFGVAGIRYGNGAQHTADFYREYFDEILEGARVLISGHGVSASELDEMVGAAQNVGLVIGVDPTLMNLHSFTQGTRVVKVQYVNMPVDGRPNPEGYAAEIIGYVVNGSPYCTPKH